VDRSTSISRALLAAAFAIGAGCVHAPPLPPPEPYQVQILEEAMRRLEAMGKDASRSRVIIAEHLRQEDAEVLAAKGVTDDAGIWRVSFTPDVAWSMLPIPTQTDFGGEVTFYFRPPSTEPFAVDDGDDE